jgi:hypothetical protein
MWTPEYERHQRSEAISPNFTSPPVPFALANEVNE